ncbi:MAG: heme ABC transporter ATP-binding protein [Chloroflexi bacterium]|nr:MAG: heme ABC transporter ATP-binding protein [Chloroflexota bacterium]
MLQIQNLTVHYGQRRALNNVSLNVQKGELMALLGPNGSGKSTLIRALSGVQRATSGSLSLFGHPLNGLTPTERARLMAVVPQALTMPPAFTVWETVLLGRTPYLNFLGQISARDEDIARRALEKADALHLADRLVGELSGGEQQRVLLARALAQATPVLLLDEPTTHLDLQHQLCLLELVRHLAHDENLTVLVALHDLNLAARYADRVALIVRGELKATGTPKQVLSPELISQVYQVPVQVIPHPFLDTPLILPDIQ